MTKHSHKFLSILAASLLVPPGVLLAQSSDPTENVATEIEEIVVLGRAQEFYRIDESTVGTKTPTDFLSIPQGVQVLSRQLIEDQAATKVTDLYRSISGVTEFSYAGVTFRGFRQENEIRYDGVAGDPFAGFSIPQLFNIERVEVLKGPSSMLYGVAEPGGVINYVTKKPTDYGIGNITIFMGNYDHYGASGEFSGPVNESGTVRGRLGGYNQSKKPFRRGTSEDNLIVDAALEFDLGSSTILLVQGTYLEQELFGHRIRGIPVNDDGDFLADIRWNAAEPSDFQLLEATILQAVGKHEFGNGLSSTLTLRQLSNERHQAYHEPRGFTDSDGDGLSDAMIREFRDQLRENDDFSITLDNVFTTSIGGREHMVLIGVDYWESDSDRDLRDTPNFPAAEALSLSDPVYGQVNLVSINAALERDALNGNSLWLVDVERTGFFLQDQFKLTDQWEAVVGLRYDSFDSRDERPLGRIRGSFDDSNVSIRGGLIFRPRDDFATYVSYAEGFIPQFEGNQERSNGPFDPLISDSLEVGVKTDLLDGAVQASLVGYSIVKQNLLQPDPDPNAPADALIAFGEVESQGVELDVVADLSERWVLVFNYAYNKTEIKKGIVGARFTNPGLSNFVGQELANAPNNAVGLWTRFEFPGISSSIAFGLDHIDDRMNLGGQRVKPYTVYDLSWQTDWNKFNIQINVKNLTDKEYAAAGFFRGDFPGEPRTVIFQLSRSFSD